jgi:hypothetical protein
MVWYRRVQDQQLELNSALRNISMQIEQYNHAADQYKSEFVKDGSQQVPVKLNHMTDFEGM